MKHLKHAYETLAATPDLFLKHLDETLATYVPNSMCMKRWQKTPESITCVKTRRGGGSMKEAIGDAARRCGGPAVVRRSGVGGSARQQREETVQQVSGCADEMSG